MLSKAKSRRAGTTTIYLVRHGEVHNPNKVFYERIPGFHLSELGKTQAHALGKHLSSQQITHVYASPLERTQETAQIITSYISNLTIFPDERLIEVSSVKRGLKIAEMEKERWNFYKPKYTKLGGEKLSDVWKRMSHFFREKMLKHKGEEIVVVSHGDPVMISMIKHKGKRLSVSAIRSTPYVQTANGFRFEFDELGAVEVSSLDF